MKPIKWHLGKLVMGCVLACCLSANLQAQLSTSTLSSDAAQPDSVVAITADAYGLEAVSVDDLPNRNGNYTGTYWVVSPYGIIPPFPCLTGQYTNCPVWEISDSVYLVDGTQNQVAINVRQLSGRQTLTAANMNTAAAAAVNALGNNVADLVDQIQYSQFMRATAVMMGVPTPGDGFGDDSGTNGYLASYFCYSIDTNQLWLEITNVSNGWSYCNLHNATNQVYAIWTTTNLLQPFTVETELWPTDTNCQPFVLLNSGRQYLFVRAEDWTGVDSDNDGVPDWWSWKYFGAINLTDTNLDYSGNNYSFAYESSNRITPTVFKYTGLEIPNNYVNSSQPTVQLDVSGTPYYIATLIDDNNFSNAVWNTYSGSTVTVNLGTTEGWHEVWIGLRAHADDPTSAIWQRKRLKLDWTSPALFITNPTNTTVDIPMIQLQGFSPEALGSISYDLTNAAGLFTNQQILVLNQYYDTTTWEFTTNTWQAFDVMLTNGVNTFIFHATDLAGNATTANYSVTLDYSAKTNAPTVQLTWPQDGMMIADNSVTICGQVDDPTATVSATLTDTNGSSNTFAGMVERNGRFWVDNLPLNSGTNVVSITVSDVVSKRVTTTLNLVQNSNTLTLDPIADPNQLWQPTINVRGHISDNTATIYVNGVQGTNNGGGTWNAANVPNTPGGVAIFNLNAVTTGGSEFNNSTNFDKPPRLYMASYGMTNRVDWNSNDWLGYDDTGTNLLYEHFLDEHDLTMVNWQDGKGGWENQDVDWKQIDTDTVSQTGTNSTHTRFDWPVDSWEHLSNGVVRSSYAAYMLNQPPDIGGYTNSCPPAPLQQEHCDARMSLDMTGAGEWLYGIMQSSGCYQYQRNAQAVLRLETGGRAGSYRRNLFCFPITAEAQKLSRSGNEAWTTIDDVGQILSTSAPINIGTLGQVGSDGKLWVVLPDGTNIDVTPFIPGKEFYTFNELKPAKYHPYISLSTSTTNADLDIDIPEICVGQKAIFTLSGLPTESIVSMVGNWTLPEKFVNSKIQYVYGVTSPNYYIFDRLLQNSNQTTCWFVNGKGGHVLVGMSLIFNNNQHAGVAANGNVSVYRPSYSNFSTTNTSSGVFTNSPRMFLWDGTILSYGNNETGEHGQRWSVDVISKYNGTIGILQLVNARYTQNYGWFPDTRDTLNTHEYFWLDGSPTSSYQDPFNYNESQYYAENTNSYNIFIDDQPKEELWAASPINVRVWGQFQDYLRFMPSGADNISITLATNSWMMEGLATLTGGIATNSTPVPTAPVECDQFPVWDQVKTSK